MCYRKWSSKEETWAKLDLVGHLLPRYGHTSHLLDDNLYLVGGMNTLAGQQPGLAKIGLKTLTVTEFSLQVSFHVEKLNVINPRVPA